MFSSFPGLYVVDVGNTHSRPPLVATSRKVSTHCWVSSRQQNCPLLRTSALGWSLGELSGECRKEESFMTMFSSAESTQEKEPGKRRPTAVIFVFSSGCRGWHSSAREFSLRVFQEVPVSGAWGWNHLQVIPSCVCLQLRLCRHLSPSLCGLSSRETSG